VARTLLGDLGHGLRNLTNRAPVTYAPGGGRSGLLSNIVRPAGQEAQMRAMGTVGTLFAIVERITTAYSQVEWHLYRSSKSGRPEDRVEVTSHAALDLWNQPNPFMTGPQWREATQQHEELTGEQWWIPAFHERSTIPLELWFARPDRMTPVPDRETFLSGYVYSSPTGEQVPLGVDEVIMLRRPNPLDPYRGWGPVQTILADLDSSRASAEWNANFFRNSAQPGGIVEAEKRLSDEEFNEFRDRWNEQHRGVANAHRVAVLENGLKWQDRSFSMNDMQFVELRDAGREIIREAFGFPKPMLGTVDDANRANMEAAEAIFSKWLVRTRLRRTRQALNTRLLPLYGALGKGLEFDFEDPVTGDVEMESKQLTAQANAAQSLVSSGYDPQAVAQAVGLPELPFDADRDLLARIVRGAPSLGPLILPMLGFELPPGWRSLMPGGRGDDSEDTATPSNLWAPPTWAVPEIEAAQRWVVKITDDGDTCHNCREQDGRTYKNREQAYKDYPEGEGYVRCEGVAYGNACRCKVVKRGRKGEGE
jgi:HK97 family phage portal protein